jgi:ribosomal protein S27AE
MLLDEAVPRLSSGGIALCHFCQRDVYFAGGFLNLAVRKIEYLAQHTKPKGFCPRCGATKLYMISRGSRLRCGECRHEFSPRKATARASGKKPDDWYDRVLALREAGHNPRQISKLMGCYDARPIYDFFKRHDLESSFSEGK